ncbi:DUF1963 domain-containing protein [Streptomyces sp. NPDC051018]|uniref:DUF1963 domain-containing protein n=1 Tax=Streptomyces sp. NPDC051018 TaxID=3365639 RepID=UPI0037971986
MPATLEWPVWEGQGPLSFIASLDCAGLPTGVLDIDLPEVGTLLFFYFDGQLDDGEALVLAEDRESWAGARVVYLAADEQVADRGTPGGLKPYPVVPLTARVEMTAASPGIRPSGSPSLRMPRWGIGTTTPSAHRSSSTRCGSSMMR